MSVIIANDIPFTAGQENPLLSIGDAIAFDSGDWGLTRAMAWIYGIVLGWDDEDDPSDNGAMDEVARKFDWSPEAVARLRRLHERFAELERTS